MDSGRTSGKEMKNNRVLLHALTWNPSLVKLIRWKVKELCCRLMAVLISGILVTWTKSSPVRLKSEKSVEQTLSLGCSSSSSSLCAVRHEGCGGVRLDSRTEYAYFMLNIVCDGSTVERTAPCTFSLSPLSHTLLFLSFFRAYKHTERERESPPLSLYSDLSALSSVERAKVFNCHMAYSNK